MKATVRSGLAGVAAAAVALGAAESVAAGTGADSSPLVAVGAVVVDHVPASVKDFGIAVFGVHDKTALLVGTAILLACYAYGLGVVGRRRWPWAVAGIGLFAVAGVVAAVTRPGAGATAALPALIGAGLAVPVLRYLLAAADGRSESGHRGAAAAGGTDRGGAPAAEAGRDEGAGTAVHAYPRESRRRFLKGLGIAGVAALAAGGAGRLIGSRRAVTSARQSVVLPVAAEPAPVVPAAAQVSGAVPWVTPNREFYRIDTALVTPQVDPSSWTLRIHGMVRNPITITWAELLQRPMVERHVTIACVSNEVGGDLIGNALWLGTPIKALIDEADPLPEADQAVQRSADGWTCGTPTAVLRDGRDALLAIGMNGEALPVPHGFPVRMIVPGLYGYVSACKWITEIELTRFADFDAYWVPRGWSAQGPIKTQSRIDSPRDGASKPAGAVTVAGVAWAQHRGVAKVELQVDEGDWETVTLAPTVSADTWRQWTHTWQATPGTHTLRVRATDLDGAVQTADTAPPAPDGATGWHQVNIDVE
ncbi:molybdopterin-dependent oxidoreductase [Actinoplanes sp. NBRC 101535]|uniref:molybdopterin-dependent oxidoreductase n=1 Tax=Actinoplanes sp. NBRC 101535 TaxID=3032196 RepID=UPI0024A4079E|nr:molybdopterin-dependent oxidoreductase [Actinoplanes sp. NBRC 101535]GLY00903.1 oxidoreductase [Actinoplanes sp. NBRC 101535]